MHWTPENDITLRDLFNEGFSDRQIAKYFQCGSTAVENRRKRLKLRRSFGSQVQAPDLPTAKYPTGPEIDALFRAAERPAKREIVFTSQAPPSLLSRGEAMT